MAAHSPLVNTIFNVGSFCFDVKFYSYNMECMMQLGLSTNFTASFLLQLILITAVEEVEDLIEVAGEEEEEEEEEGGEEEVGEEEEEEEVGLEEGAEEGISVEEVILVVEEEEDVVALTGTGMW